MIPLVPWRLKRFLAYNVPLAYSIVVNRGLPIPRMGEGIWLRELWDDPNWDWPLKNRLIRNLTSPSDRILDLGTGTGGILRFLKAEGYENLAAMDAAAYPLNRLREIGIEGRQGVLPAIPFDAGTFDFVIASQVLEHIVRRHKFLREIRRVLKPGGRAAIFVPDWCLTPADEPTHVAVYNIATLAKLLRQHFRVQRVESVRDDNHQMNVLFALVSAE
ncbi:MAG: class I SAM-dependent methyltransferase [Pseudomonadota bacterium]